MTSAFLKLLQMVSKPT